MISSSLAKTAQRWYPNGMEAEEPIKKTTVYVPRSVHERVQAAARKHRRSFNSELIWLLEQALAEVEEQKEKPGATR